MKLNTKNLFEPSKSLKTTPRPKILKQKKLIKTSPLIKENKTVKNKVNPNPNMKSNLKQKLFQNSNKKINPFTLSLEKNQDLKNTKMVRTQTSKKVNLNIDIIENNDLFENSFTNNLVLTNESDTIDNNKLIIISKIK